MKFSLCLHMERTETNQTYKQIYDEFIELCLIADKGGFNTIWTGEHHGMDFSISPNPLLILSDLANKTKHVRLGTATLIAPFWHPVKLAGELALTDIICDGRLDIGFSKGAYSYEYDRLVPGINKHSAGEILREMIPAIKKLWKGNYSHSSKLWEFPNTTASPSPMQKPHPPIWIACEHAYTFNFALENNCNIMVAPLWANDVQAQELMSRFNRAVLDNEITVKPQIMILRHTYVSESEKELSEASEMFSKYYCEFNRWFQNKDIVQNAVMCANNEDEKLDECFKADNLRDNLMIGTPNDIIKRLSKYEELGYDEYALWMANGMSFSYKKKMLELFIDKIMPSFK